MERKKRRRTRKGIYWKSYHRRVLHFKFAVQEPPMMQPPIDSPFLVLLVFVPVAHLRILAGMSLSRRDVLKTAAVGSLAMAAGMDDVFGQARPALPNIVYMMAD